MPVRNVELLNNLADLFEHHENEEIPLPEGMPDLGYNQGEWAQHSDITVDASTREEALQEVPAEDHLCGTFACIAGHAVIVGGDVKIKWKLFEDSNSNWVDAYDEENGEEQGGYYEEVSYFYWEAYYRHADGTEISWENEGRELLGLYRTEAAELFSGTWRPAVSVAQSLRDLANGAHICDVTGSYIHRDNIEYLINRDIRDEEMDALESAAAEEQEDAYYDEDYDG